MAEIIIGGCILNSFICCTVFGTGVTQAWRWGEKSSVIWKVGHNTADQDDLRLFEHSVKDDPGFRFLVNSWANLLGSHCLCGCRAQHSRAAKLLKRVLRALLDSKSGRSEPSLASLFRENANEFPEAKTDGEKHILAVEQNMTSAPSSQRMGRSSLPEYPTKTQADALNEAARSGARLILSDDRGGLGVSSGEMASLKGQVSSRSTSDCSSLTDNQDSPRIVRRSNSSIKVSSLGAWRSQRAMTPQATPESKASGTSSLTTKDHTGAPLKDNPIQQPRGGLRHQSTNRTPTGGHQITFDPTSLVLEHKTQRGRSDKDKQQHQGMLSPRSPRGSPRIEGQSSGNKPRKIQAQTLPMPSRELLSQTGR